MKRRKKKQTRPRIDVNVRQLDEIVDKAGKEPLSEPECELLKVSIHAMAERLMPQPRKSEKAEGLLEGAAGSDQEDSNDSGEAVATTEEKAKKPRPGHGRNGAADFSGATRIPVPHQELTPKCVCPGCHKGKVYELKHPKPLIRILGMPPINATVYELQKLRCNLCGEIYTAEEPDGVGSEKYDASVVSMVAQLKYGSGTPFNRIENLQRQMGVPLPATTQWDLVNKGAKELQPALAELIRLAAQGTVFYDDDTTVRILDAVVRPEAQDKDRTGLHTTGVVSKFEDRQIALFISGPQHAGENMGDLLAKRAEGLPAPVIMSDALSSNKPKLPPGVELLIANCLTHGRRQFVDIFESFPEDCQHVILQLGQVYWNDEQARKRSMDPQERLQFHQAESGPVMDALKIWMETQLSEKKTEPNSGLGKAINYFLKRWDRLTLFLRHPGGPLDNNAAERALKKAVLHRKNALFYKTLHGAGVGDLYMSLIYTCELNRVNSFEYITALLRHAAEVQADASAWLPWNYHLQLRPAPD